MHQEAPGFSAAIAAVQKIESVPLILEMVKQATGMRFAAVARVTDRHWVTCAVDDSIAVSYTHLTLPTTPYV